MQNTKPLWCIVSISDATAEAWVVGAHTTKKECQDSLFYLRWYDRINGANRRYAITREDKLYTFGKE